MVASIDRGAHCYRRAELALAAATELPPPQFSFDSRNACNASRRRTHLAVPCTISCKLPAASLAFDRAAWVGHGAAIAADPSALIAPAGASNLDCFRFRRIRAYRTNSLQGAEPPIASAQLQYSPHLATAVPYQDPYQLSPILFESAHRFPFDHAPCARPSNGPSPEPAMGQLRQHNRYGYDGCAQQQC